MPKKLILESYNYASERILILDNDECTGFYQLLSLFYCMHLHYTGKQPEYSICVNYLKQGGARPGTKELFQRAYFLKKHKYLDKLCIFTAASNHSGWVSFLATLLEIYSDIPIGTIDNVFSKDHIQFGITKNLKLLFYDTSKCMMIDDKPEHIIAGHGSKIIKVDKYIHHVKLDELILYLPENTQDLARENIKIDEQHSKIPFTEYTEERMSNEKTLFDIIKQVDDYFLTQHKISKL